MPCLHGHDGELDLGGAGGAEGVVAEQPALVGERCRHALVALHREGVECNLELIALTLVVYPYDRDSRSVEELFANEVFAGIMVYAGMYNGYELHHVLTRHHRPIPGVTCGRLPMLEVD